MHASYNEQWRLRSVSERFITNVRGTACREKISRGGTIKWQFHCTVRWARISPIKLKPDDMAKNRQKIRAGATSSTFIAVWMLAKGGGQRLSILYMAFDANGETNR